VSDHVKVSAAWDGERLQLDDVVAFNALVRRKLKPGDGEAFIVRVEREADAKRTHRLKWYYGYIVKQCCAKTGYTVLEMDTIFRAECLPPDVETISHMSDEQMADYNTLCEKFAAEAIGVVVEGPNDARRWAA
jgi:hypothetical protein